MPTSSAKTKPRTPSDEDPSTLIELSEGAADAWMIQRHFSLAELAESKGLTLGDLLRSFDDRQSLLAYFYESRWVVYSTLKAKVPNFESYSVEEKLGNLFYSLIDLMSDRKAFVRLTAFDHLSPDPRPGAQANPFQREFREEIRAILSTAEVSAAGRLLSITPVLDSVYFSFLGILRYWLSDESKEGERTAALIDKWIALIAELFRTAVADKAVDLARFLAKDFREALPDRVPLDGVFRHIQDAAHQLRETAKRAVDTLSNDTPRRK